MTVAELQERIWTRLDEDTATPTFYTPAETLTAINWAQRLFVLLTLQLETTAVFNLSPGVTWYNMLTTFPDWIAPLEIRVVGGGKVRPARLDDLDARNAQWEAALGPPVRYVHIGFDTLAFDPHAMDGATSVSIVYARAPAVLSALSTPEIAEEYHPALVDAAIPFLRAKEGGQELAKSVGLFERFLETARTAAEFTRARNKASRYDRTPVELQRQDRSRLLDPARRGRKDAWLLA